jgi:hypothetical protein
MVSGKLEPTFEEVEQAGQKHFIHIELMQIASAEVDGKPLSINVSPYHIRVHYKDRTVEFSTQEMAQEAVEMIDQVHPK